MFYFHIQMSKWGLETNFAQHKKYIRGSIFTCVLTVSLAMCYSIIAMANKAELDVIFKILMSFSLILIGTSHIAISFIYVYLLVSVGSRFTLLNIALR